MMESGQGQRLMLHECLTGISGTAIKQTVSHDKANDAMTIVTERA
jgi:hypothetical protein